MRELVWGRRITRAGRVFAAAITCALAAGCSELFGPSGPKITISISLARPIEPAPRLRASIGGRRTDVAASPRGSTRAERSVRGPRYGWVPVEITLLGSSDDTLAAVTFSQQFRRGDNNWVSAVVSGTRPQGMCIGVVSAAAMRATPADTLFVMYGGIPEGVIC